MDFVIAAWAVSDSLQDSNIILSANSSWIPQVKLVTL